MPSTPKLAGSKSGEAATLAVRAEASVTAMVALPSTRSITEVMVVDRATIYVERGGKLELTGKSAKCEFQLAADKELKFDIVNSTADRKNKPLGYKQLRASASGQTLRIAAAFNPWKKTAFTVKLAPKGTSEAEIVVSGGGISDRFVWKLAPDTNAPSQLVKQAR